jgi:SlyX protein
MTPEQFEHRLTELETRIAFQEHALVELSDALAAARDEETRTALLLHRALEELKTIRSTLSAAPVTGDASLEAPPPHY